MHPRCHPQMITVSQRSRGAACTGQPHSSPSIQIRRRWRRRGSGSRQPCLHAGAGRVRVGGAEGRVGEERRCERQLSRLNAVPRLWTAR